MEGFSRFARGLAVNPTSPDVACQGVGLVIVT
jgi:hypothetical protein